MIVCKHQKSLTMNACFKKFTLLHFQCQIGHLNSLQMMDIIRAAVTESDPPQPTKFWNMLTAEDQKEFLKLKTAFHRSGTASGKDRRVATFRKELCSVLAFLERDSAHREERSIVSGIAFAGPFICVNTRQLKAFLGRCKSSINGSFQQMGYVALRTKTKARNCITTIMRPLFKEQTILRQWTVRCAARNAECCFVSSFPVSSLPPVSETDLIDDRPRPVSQNHQIMRRYPEAPVTRPQSVLPQPMRRPDWYSVECLANFDDSQWGLPCSTFSDDDLGMTTATPWDLSVGLGQPTFPEEQQPPEPFADMWIQFDGRP